MPSRIGRYAVRRRIGSGGFATVWLADDEHLDAPVAIKVLADNWTEDHQIRRRFLEEGRYLRKVESPHVVTVYDAGEFEDGRPYLVMSYADQGTLADRLQAGPLSVAQTMDVVRQVGAGLQALHDRGILHRDIKPANVLFRTVERPGAEPHVRAMVGDLGLGKALDVSSRLTMIAGTPSFVAPEQAGAESPDARADQYSLAALAYLLLTGRTPFAHTSLAEAANPGALAAASTPARPFPPAVDAALRRGLSREREDRFPDVTAFVTALEDSLRGVPDDAPDSATYVEVDPERTRPHPRPSPLPAGPPRRRLSRALVAGGVALAVGAVGGYAVQRAVAADERTVTDDTGTLSVVVPAAWDRADATDGWRPPDAESTYPALSVGTSGSWSDEDSAGSGTFVALLPGSKLPAELPRHDECDTAGSPVRDTIDGDSSLTVVYGDCPGGVVVERLVQVTADEQLWVQVRSEERATANDVLDGVATHGMG
jgi:hypothetical protein